VGIESPISGGPDAPLPSTHGACTDGSAVSLPPVANSGACAGSGFFVDGPTATLCPETCAAAEADETATPGNAEYREMQARWSAQASVAPPASAVPARAAAGGGWAGGRCCARRG
jgi:hypothetical protein